MTHDRRPGRLDDATVEAVGAVSEALEWVERARGQLYAFHQLMGHADLILGDACDKLPDAGHGAVADRLQKNMTLDGCVEMLDDWFDPQLQDDDLLEESHRQDVEADALLVGRRTFEDFRSYWPAQANDATGVTDYLNQVAKYVVSATIDDPGWQNSTVLRGDPVHEVRALKDRPGKDIVLTGSISLAHTLIAAGVVDEFRLFVYPVIQCRGRRLFPAAARLRLLGPPKSFSSGIVLLRYGWQE